MKLKVSFLGKRAETEKKNETNFEYYLLCVPVKKGNEVTHLNCQRAFQARGTLPALISSRYTTRLRDLGLLLER